MTAANAGRSGGEKPSPAQREPSAARRWSGRSRSLGVTMGSRSRSRWPSSSSRNGAAAAAEWV